MNLTTQAKVTNLTRWIHFHYFVCSIALLGSQRTWAVPYLGRFRYLTLESFSLQ